MGSRLLAAMWDNDGSSGSAGASAAGSEEARNNKDMCSENLANKHVRAYVKLLLDLTTIEGVRLPVSQPSA